MSDLKTEWLQIDKLTMPFEPTLPVVKRVELIMTVLADRNANIEALRKKNAELNNWCQCCEKALRKELPHLERKGVPLGRVMANVAAAMYKRWVVRAVAEFSRIEWHGGDCGGECISCGEWQNHAPICELAALIKEAKEWK